MCAHDDEYLYMRCTCGGVLRRLRVEGGGEDEHAGDAEEGGEGARGDDLHDVDLDRVGGVRLRLSDGVVLEAEHDQLEHDAG